MRISDWSSDVCSSDLGELPTSLKPRETRAPRWILELRTADAIATGATQHEIAQAFFGSAVASERWRKESSPYRSRVRSEEHTSELQSLMRISYAVLCLKKKNKNTYSTKVLRKYKATTQHAIHTKT